MIKTVIVKNTRDQKNYTFENVEVSKLKDVKDLLTAKNVDLTNLEFHVGFANIVLLDDNSPIPEKVTKRDGTEITDTIVFLLTNSANNIKSGIDRSCIINQIRQDNNLKGWIKAKCGKPYTNVTTALLADMLETYNKSSVNTSSNTNTDDSVKTAFITLLDIMFSGDLLSYNEYHTIKGILVPSVSNTEALLKEAELEANL